MPKCPYCRYDVDESPAPDSPALLVGCPTCLNPFLVVAGGAGEEPTARTITGVTDLRESAVPGSVMEGILQTARAEMDDISPFPEVTQRVLSMVNDPVTSIMDLSEVIAEDPVISQRIRRLANSVFYSSMHEIGDLNAACTRVGMRAISNIAAAAAAGQHFIARTPRYRTMMDELWKHSVATAHCAQVIADKLGTVNGGVAFVTGLSHDIGKQMLIDVVGAKYKGNLGQLRESDALLLKVLDRFHPVIGTHIVRRWQLPPDMVMAVYGQTNPDAVEDPGQRALTQVIIVANALSYACGYGLGLPEDFVPRAPEEIAMAIGHRPTAKALGLGEAAILETLQGLPDELHVMVEIMQAA